MELRIHIPEGFRFSPYLSRFLSSSLLKIGGVQDVSGTKGKKVGEESFRTRRVVIRARYFPGACSC